MKTLLSICLLAATGFTVSTLKSQSVYAPYAFFRIAGKAGVSGNVDGVGENARFYGPALGAVDVAGGFYVPDLGNHTIRRVRWAGTNWIVSTLAGRAGSPGAANGTNTPRASAHLPKWHLMLWGTSSWRIGTTT